MSRLKGTLLAAVLSMGLAAVGAATVACGTAVARETAVGAEKSPPGDIPDSQIFVQYKSPLGFSIKVPEGWSRAERADGARFFDKYNVIDLVVSRTDTAPNAAEWKERATVELRKAGGAAEMKAVKNVNLASGPGVLISYVSNSTRNPVTDRQVRVEHARYLLFRNGTLVSLDLSAPLGADNVDQWKLMSNSFRWQ